MCWYSSCRKHCREASVFAKRDADIEVILRNSSREVVYIPLRPRPKKLS